MDTNVNAMQAGGIKEMLDTERLINHGIVQEMTKIKEKRLMREKKAN